MVSNGKKVLLSILVAAVLILGIITVSAAQSAQGGTTDAASFGATAPAQTCSAAAIGGECGCGASCSQSCGASCGCSAAKTGSCGCGK